MRPRVLLKMSADTSSQYYHLVKEHGERKVKRTSQTTQSAAKQNKECRRTPPISTSNTVSHLIDLIWSSQNPNSTLSLVSRVSIRHILDKFSKIKVQTASPFVHGLSMVYTLYNFLHSEHLGSASNPTRP